MDQIEEDHHQLFTTVLGGATDRKDNGTNFEVAWDATPGQLLHLRYFCGGLATVFANTMSVEFDFSILKWELDENRTGMTDILVKRVFQAKQRAMLDMNHWLHWMQKLTLMACIK